MTELDINIIPPKQEVSTNGTATTPEPVANASVPDLKPETAKETLVNAEKESKQLHPEVRPHAFVVMPFGKKKGADNQPYDFNSIYNILIKPALEDAGFEAFRADEETSAGDILTDMFQELLLADMVICDLSIDNANAFYELGIRHALRLGTIIITQSFESVPSDLRNYYCFQYKYTPLSHEEKELYTSFEHDLHEKIAHVVRNPAETDSPVSDFLNFDHFYVKRQEEKDFVSTKGRTGWSGLFVYRGYE